jgi:hypothetical protein
MNTIQENTNMVLTPLESLTTLTEEVKALKERVQSIVAVQPKQLYTNKSLKELLGVGDKLIKQYRDNGLLSFTQVGDKFWYSQEDVHKFLAVSHNEAWNV